MLTQLFSIELCFGVVITFNPHSIAMSLLTMRVHHRMHTTTIRRGQGDLSLGHQRKNICI